MVDCPHENKQHRIWYWVVNNDPVPAPYEAVVDNHADAQGAIDRLMAQPAIKWAKAFRADNEFYTCIRRQKEVDLQSDSYRFRVTEDSEQVKGSLWSRVKEWLGL